MSRSNTVTDTEPASQKSRLSPLWRYLLFVVVIPYLVVGLTSGMQGRRSKLSPPEIISSEKRAGLPVSQEHIDKVMRPWLSERLSDIDAHMAYIDLSLEPRGDRNRSTWGGTDDGLWSYYRDLESTTSGTVHDAALWGLAYCEFHRDSSQRVITLLGSISDQRLPYIDLLRGVALHRLGEHARADSVLRAAIDAGRSPAIATGLVATALLESHDWQGLDMLRANPRARPYVPNRALRILDIRHAAILDYLSRLIRAQAVPVIPGLILLVVYATGVWFFLIRWWDAFEKEPWSTSVLAVLLGVATPIGVSVFHDVVSEFWNPTLTGTPFLDFLYFVVIVGLVEESLKIIPVFLLGRFSARQMNERSDWMIYGALSALGFSLNENYDYLIQNGAQVDVGRFFLATPLHISLTGCLALTLRRIYLREPLAWRRFGLALAGVAIIHGTFDFLVSLHSMEARLAGVILGPLWGLVFLRIFGSVVSTSPFRNNRDKYQVSCTSWFMGAFAVLCLFNYLVAAAALGSDAVIPKLRSDLVAGQIFVLIGLVYSRLNFAPLESRLLRQPTRTAASPAPNPAAAE